MKKQALLGLLLAVGISFFVAHTSRAHVLVMDESRQIGAILHVVPDDDPIAGKKATLFFDMQSGSLDDVRQATITITRQLTERHDTLAANIDGSLVTADYVFPQQGVYAIQYTLVSSNKDYIFNHTLRVSRGENVSHQSRRRHAWAEGLLVGGVVSFLVLGVLFWNNRKHIARQSMF